MADAAKKQTRRRLTPRTVETLKAPKLAPSDRRDGRRFVMDAEVSGFGVKVTETGTRSYVLIKRYPGFRHPTAREIGRCDALTLDEARAKARRWNGLIAKGIDPADAERQAELEAARKRANTVAAVAEDFFKEKLVGERKGREVERDMRKVFVTPWAKRPIGEITPLDVRSIIAERRQEAPSHARNLLGYARRFFDWAIAKDGAYGISSNPCQNIKPKSEIGEKTDRDRVLEDDEILAFWRAARRMPYPFGPVYQLLLLTGLRLNEVADARWSEFDSRNAIWIIPAARMKGKDGKVREHVVPVTDDIYAILKSLPLFKSGDYLFSTTFGKKPAWISAKVKRRLDARMVRTLRAMARIHGEDAAKVELKPFVNHDLRRTMRTGLSKLRIDADIRELMLAHVMPHLIKTYDRYDFLIEKRHALECWSEYVWNLVQPKPDNVIRLQSSGSARQLQ